MTSDCLNETTSGHFADDTFIMYSDKKLKTIETVVNTELKQVLTWLRLNKLSLNAGKTELIFFHSKKHSFEYVNISIKFNGQKLVPVDHIKYLGMYIDKYLSWNFHVWGLTTEENIKKIEILQKKCVRIMSFSDFNSHTNQLFVDLKLLKVRNIFFIFFLWILF